MCIQRHAAVLQVATTQCSPHEDHRTLTGECSKPLQQLLQLSHSGDDDLWCIGLAELLCCWTFARQSAHDQANAWLLLLSHCCRWRPVAWVLEFSVTPSGRSFKVVVNNKQALPSMRGFWQLLLRCDVKRATLVYSFKRTQSTQDEVCKASAVLRMS